MKDNRNLLRKIFQKYSKTPTGPIQLLLDTLADKDEEVKATIESSLLRIAEKRTDELLQVLCEFKKNTPKLSECSTAIILR
jgi:maestro heat-like repeat-containing protein family member 1